MYIFALLQQYSLEELLYEYYDREQRDLYDEERTAQSADKMEDEKLDDALAWADQEEAKEKGPVAPAIDNSDRAWMEKQEQEAAVDFGDIHEEF